MHAMHIQLCGIGAEAWHIVSAASHALHRMCCIKCGASNCSY